MSNNDLFVEFSNIDGYEDTKNVYEYFISQFEKEVYTLEEAQVLAYIEEYGEREPKYYIDKIRQYKETDTQNTPQIAKNKKKQSYIPGDKRSAIQKGIAEIESIGPSFDTFQKNFKNRISRLLSLTTGEKFTFQSFKNSDNKDHNSTYFFCIDELFFLIFFCSTYNSDDYMHFISYEFDLVDEEYLKLLKYGISLIIKNHPSDATLDDVNYQFDIAFGLSLRKMFADYNHLGDIIDEVALFPQSKTNAEKTRKKCISMLRECEKSLIQLWNPSTAQLLQYRYENMGRIIYAICRNHSKSPEFYFKFRPSLDILETHDNKVSPLKSLIEDKSKYSQVKELYSQCIKHFAAYKENMIKLQNMIDSKKYGLDEQTKHQNCSELLNSYNEELMSLRNSLFASTSQNRRKK